MKANSFFSRTHALSLVIALFLLVAGMLAVFEPQQAEAGADLQEVPLALDKWSVEVWPEYDRPSVLVLLNGTAQATAALPATVRIPVPLGSEINAVAFPGADGRLISIPWTTEATSGGQDVVFTLEQPDFVVEYYSDVISPPPSRSFALDLVAPYAATQASVTLRQPARASDLSTVPEMQPAGLDALGNPLYSLQLGPVSADQAIPLSVTYTKADANPTVANAVVEDNAAGTAVSTSGSIDWVPLVIGLVVGVVVIAGIGYLLWRRGQPAGGSRQARRRAAREKGVVAERPASTASPAKSAKNVFCPQCGTQFEAADKFCRSCGAVR